MLFYFLCFVSLLQHLSLLYKIFELNKNEFPHVMYVVGTHLSANHTPALIFCEVLSDVQHT